MAFRALATGPVSFLDANSAQRQIPLSAISFGSNGVDASAWPNYAANKTLLDALLPQLVAQGLLTQGPLMPSPGPPPPETAATPD